MKIRNRLLAIRKQSRIELPKEDIWFFNENNPVNQSSASIRKTSRNDRLSILNEDYDRFSLNSSGRNRLKRGSSFVVDWQMSDFF